MVTAVGALFWMGLIFLVFGVLALVAERLDARDERRDDDGR